MQQLSPRKTRAWPKLSTAEIPDDRRFQSPYAVCRTTSVFGCYPFQGEPVKTVTSSRLRLHYSHARNDRTITSRTENRIQATTPFYQQQRIRQASTARERLTREEAEHHAIRIREAGDWVYKNLGSKRSAV